MDVLLIQNRLAEALNECEAALRVLPHSVWILGYMGQLYAREGNSKESAKFFKMALDEGTNRTFRNEIGASEDWQSAEDADNYSAVVSALQYQHLYKESEKYINKLLVLFPNSSDALNNLGVAY